ncbi:MAG: hypothetical protein V4440_02235 [Pseudomonadota bacterium]
MMNYDYSYGMMNGTYGNGMMAFGWLVSLLVIADLILAAVAMWKYINKK